MTSSARKLPVRPLGAAAVVVVLVLGVIAVLGLPGGSERKTVTAHFDRAVSVYRGTEVRIMGVTVGEVTAVVPEGRSVRVEMAYDATYDVPADAKAAIVTPTLVADRFVQLAPVYTGGKVMADGAEIPLEGTRTPVELDRIYSSLQMLTQTLGPEGVNSDGTLDELLRAGAETLDGRGAQANQMIRDLSALTQTLDANSGDLFATIEHLGAFTRTLARNDRVVDAFMGDVARASSQLSGEREELAAALEAIAGAVGTVRTFVKDHRKALVGEVESLTTVLDALAAEQDSLATALELGPLGAGNLALGFDTLTGSQNARLQIGPAAEDLDGLLCTIVTNARVPRAPAVCQLLKQLVGPLSLRTPDLGARAGRASTRMPGEVKPLAGALSDLLGGAR